MIEKMKSFDEKTVFVSEIRIWSACPKQLYFKNSAEKKGHPDLLFNETRTGVFENKIMKEICFELPALVLEYFEENPDVDFAENPKLKKRLKSMATEIEKELGLERNPERETNEKESNETKLNEKESNETELNELLENKIEELIQNIDKTIQRNKINSAEKINTADLFEAAADPVAVEKTYWFSKINLAGAPPKVLELNEKPLPYLIKISKAPTNGVWESDRITAAALLILLENEFGKQFVSDSAVIDYLGDYRIIRIRPQDRRKVFRAVRKIKEIKDGKMPHEKNIRLCGKCVYREKCHIKMRSLFSKMFE